MQNQIPKNWQETKLGEIIKITRGASPRPIQNFLAPVGMPWVKIADATASNSRFIDRTNECIKLEGVKNSVVVQPGELIVSNSATPGIPKFMSIKACVHDGWLIFRNFKGILPEFTYYYMIWTRKKLVNTTTGSVFNNLKTDIVKEFKIDLPPVESQKKIADILSTFDDKIELNNKIAKTLEEMAQAIFKEWFIRKNNSNTNTKFIKDIAQVKSGNRPTKISSKRENDMIVPVYGANEIMGYTDDFLFDKRVIITGRVGTIGKVFIINEVFWPSDNVLVVIPKEEKYTYFLYLSLRRINFSSLNRGSSQPLITQGDLEKYPLPDFNEENVESFHKISFPLFDKLLKVSQENQKLAALRDLLLPKLMKGEIRV